MKHLLILLWLIPTHFYAQKSPSSVTLYNSAAEITYTEKIDLKPGKNVIVFKNLTPFIVENTLKVSSNNQDAEIISVTEKINFIGRTAIRKNKSTTIQKKITQLKRQNGLTNCKVTALTTEKNLLFHNESIGGLSYGVSVDEIEKASDFFRSRFTNIVTSLYLLNDSIAEMNDQLLRLKKELKQSQIYVDKPVSEIHLIVNSKSTKTTQFTYSFLTQKAGWAPLYDLKYQGNEKPLLFNFKANVFNATSIHWKNISIRLSTANPINGFAIPNLTDKEQKQDNIEATKGVKFKTLEVVNAIASYDVAHKYSVLSNAKPHLIDVDSYTFDATFEYWVFPRLDPFGFLMAKIPNWNKHNLIPGTTNIYSKGVYMGKTFLNTYAENDTLEIYLGKDKNIQVKRTEDFKENTRKIIGNISIDKYAINIAIINNSNENFAIKIMDQVPIIDDSDKTKLNVSQDKGVYDKKEGLLTWHIKLGAGEKTAFDFKYQIKEPKGFYGGQKKRSFRRISCPLF